MGHADGLMGGLGAHDMSVARRQKSMQSEYARQLDEQISHAASAGAPHSRDGMVLDSKSNHVDGIMGGLGAHDMSVARRQKSMQSEYARQLDEQISHAAAAGAPHSRDGMVLDSKSNHADGIMGGLGAHDMSVARRQKSMQSEYAR